MNTNLKDSGLRAKLKSQDVQKVKSKESLSIPQNENIKQVDADTESLPIIHELNSLNKLQEENQSLIEQLLQLQITIADHEALEKTHTSTLNESASKSKQLALQLDVNSNEMRTLKEQSEHITNDLEHTLR